MKLVCFLERVRACILELFEWTQWCYVNFNLGRGEFFPKQVSNKMTLWGPFCFPMCWLISLIRFLQFLEFYSLYGIWMTAPLWKHSLLFWTLCIRSNPWVPLLAFSSIRISVNFTGLLVTNFVWIPSKVCRPSLYKFLCTCYANICVTN